MSVLLWLVSFLPILASPATAMLCDRCVHNSTAAILYEEDTNYWGGTCQYGADQIEFNNAHPTGVVDTIYINGSGCGTSYQVRCKNKDICSPGGIKVIVTTNGRYPYNKADFVLSNAAFIELFKEKLRSSKYVKNLKSIDVEHKRVPSVYREHQPMKIRIENMNEKNYFAVKVLYQGGQTYIQSIDMTFERPDKWIAMKRKVGAVWDVAQTVQAGWKLKFRFKVLEGYLETKRFNTSLVQINKEKEVYGLGKQLDGIIAKEKCYKCNDTTWN